MNLVSIIIPSHNKCSYIKAAIDSSLSQTWANIEVIIVDDNSTDSTREILNSIEDKRAKMFYVSFNNASATRNFGLAKAQGVFIQFLDADDILHQDKIKRQLDDMKSNEDVLGVCNTAVFYKNIAEPISDLDSDFLRFSPDPKSFIINLYKAVDSGMVQPNAWLTPMKIIKKAGLWNEKLSVDDDGEFFCRVMLESQAIVHTDKVLNYYRKFLVNTGNLSSLKTEKACNSMYLAAVLKMKHLKKKLEVDELVLQPVINTLFVNVMVSAYPQHKNISAAAEKNINYQYPVVLPKIGGKAIEGLKFLLGWKITKKMKCMLQNINNKNYC